MVDKIIKTSKTESHILGLLLASIGGIMDAYSFVCRGHVFANAQTGNIMLLGIYLSVGDFQTALYYLCPILAFSLGIALSYVARKIKKFKSPYVWQWGLLIINALIMVGVAFLPQSLNLLANCLISLTCGVQLASFPVISGNSVATTMCIGNLHSMIREGINYFYTKNKADLKKSLLFFSVILFFVLGAILGNFLISWFAEFAIIAGSILSFVVAIVIMV